MKKLFHKEPEEEHNFWISYTDLMAGFVIVFILASFMVYNQLEGYTPSQVASMIKWHETHGNMVNINDDFKDVFEGIEGVEFVEDEGSIRIYPTYTTKKDSILFKVGSAIMEPNLKERINKVGLKFVRRAMDLKKEGKNIAEIRVEGHTDPSGYWFGKNDNGNLMLSSRRAYTVYKAIFFCCDTEKEKQFIFNNMISVGYASQKLVPNREHPDYDKCRRIEFKIIAK